MKYCIILLSITVIAYSCKSKQMTAEVKQIQEEVNLDKPSKIGQINDMLCNRKWTHAREQSPEGKALYLNAEGRTFPSSRYRNSFEFNPDGTCRYLYLSPTDRHIMIDGNYVIQDDLLIIKTSDGSNYGMFTILELDGDRLLLSAKPTVQN